MELWLGFCILSAENILLIVIFSIYNTRNIWYYASHFSLNCVTETHTHKLQLYSLKKSISASYRKLIVATKKTNLQIENKIKEHIAGVCLSYCRHEITPQLLGIFLDTGEVYKYVCIYP